MLIRVKVALKISELESTGNLFSTIYNIILSNRSLKSFEKLYDCSLELTLSRRSLCMHHKSGSAAKSVLCPQHRRFSKTL